MKNLVWALTISFFSFFAAINPSQAQGCYVQKNIQKDEASGFNVSHDSVWLNQKACELAATFLPDTSFANNFKVFSFGFYVNLDYYDEYSYPQAFIGMKEQVAQESPYYLLIGRQTDQSKIFSKFWVEVKLPTSGIFQCLTQSTRETISQRVKLAIDKKYAELGGFPNHFAEATIEGFYELEKIVTSIKMGNCCPIDPQSIIEYFVSNEFLKEDPIKILIDTMLPSFVDDEIINRNVIQTINVFDYARFLIERQGIEVNLRERLDSLLNRIDLGQGQNSIAYITKNSHFCSDTIQIVKESFNNSTNNPAIWIHLCQVSEDGTGVFLVKIKGSIYKSHKCSSPEYSYEHGLITPLSKSKLKTIANSIGFTGNNQIGEFFETAAFMSISSSKPIVRNSVVNFTSARRTQRNAPNGPNAVRPDFMGHLMQFSTNGVPAFASIDLGVFYEVKATNKTLTRAYRKYQLEGMIDVLSDLKASGPIRRGTLYLVTTCDAEVGSDLIDFAKQNCIVLYRIVAGYQDALPGQSAKLFFSIPELIGPCQDYYYELEMLWDSLELDPWNNFGKVLANSVSVWGVVDPLNPDPNDTYDDTNP